MASFTVNVDTSSLAEHIDDISRSVQDVGSAVDDMSNRLVSAEQVAAQIMSRMASICLHATSSRRRRLSLRTMSG